MTDTDTDFVEVGRKLSNGHTVSFPADLSRRYPTEPVVRNVLKASVEDLTDPDDPTVPFSNRVSGSWISHSSFTVYVMPSEGDVPYRSRAWKQMLNGLVETFGYDNVNAGGPPNSETAGYFTVRRWWFGTGGCEEGSDR